MTNAPLSPAELEAIEARVNAATEGPWRIVKYGDGDSLVIHSDDDNRVCFMATPGGSQASWRTICGNAAFIESAPVDMSRLLSALKAAREDSERLSTLLAGAVDYATAICRSEGMQPGQRPVRVTCDMYRDDGLQIDHIAVFEVKEAIAALESLTQGAAHE